MSQVAGSTPAAATIWQRFAKMLGIEERHAEDALHSERVAKHVVSRRSFIGAAGALAGASLFSFASVGDAEAAELKREFDAIVRKPHGSTLTQFDAMLKERYSAPSIAYLNPNDYTALMKILPKAEGEHPATLATIISSRMVPAGHYFKTVHRESDGMVFGIDRRPLTGS